MEDFSAYAQLKQETQQRSLNLERLLGRQLSATPTHLSRALYLPRHTDSDISHLPLYDISTRYAGTVGDATVGSSIYTVKLGTMPRPKGDGTDDVEVLYLVDFSRTEGDVSAKVQSRGPLSQAPNDDEASLKVDTSNPDEAGTIIVQDPFGTGNTVDVRLQVSYPIPASHTRVGIIAHPYFAFEVPGIFGPTLLQWQIRPKENGPLRYTLVAIPTADPQQAQEGSDKQEGTEQSEPSPEICALYHHIGLGASLSLGYSEGVLLLPSRDVGSSIQPVSDGVVIASLLLMLWRLRNIDGGKGSKTGSLKSSDSLSTSKTSKDDGVTGSSNGGRLSFLNKLRGK